MNTIAQGTTPYLQFAVAADLSNASVIYFTVKQGNTILINLTGNRITTTVEEDITTLTVHLTQEETLKLDENKKAYIQVRWRDSEDEAYETEVHQALISEALYKGVI